MIGIQNADGSIDWLFEGRADTGAKVRLSAARPGQNRIRVRIFWKDETGLVRQLGQVIFKPSQSSSAKLPQLGAVLRVDRKNYLALRIFDRQRSTRRRFRLPNLQVPAGTGQSSLPPTRLSIATRIFFILGSIGLVVALAIILWRLFV